MNPTWCPLTPSKAGGGGETEQPRKPPETEWILWVQAGGLTKAPFMGEAAGMGGPGSHKRRRRRVVGLGSKCAQPKHKDPPPKWSEDPQLELRHPREQKKSKSQGDKGEGLTADTAGSWRSHCPVHPNGYVN